jgi:hypothetical protein
MIDLWRSNCYTIRHARCFASYLNTLDVIFNISGRVFSRAINMILAKLDGEESKRALARLASLD